MTRVIRMGPIHISSVSLCVYVRVFVQVVRHDASIYGEAGGRERVQNERSMKHIGNIAGKGGDRESYFAPAISKDLNPKLHPNSFHFSPETRSKHKYVSQPMFKGTTVLLNEAKQEKEVDSRKG